MDPHFHRFGSYTSPQLPVLHKAYSNMNIWVQEKGIVLMKNIGQN